MSDPTSLPWTAIETTVRTKGYRTICNCWDSECEAGEAEANADLIVRAVNAHQALVDALRAVAHERDFVVRCNGRIQDVVRSALKLAGVKP